MLASMHITEFNISKLNVVLHWGDEAGESQVEIHLQLSDFDCVLEGHRVSEFSA